MIQGNYAENVTLFGTAGQIGIGLTGFDFLGDIRDLSYDFSNWEWSWGHAGLTGLDAVGLLPIVGAVKYADEVKALSKSDEIRIIIKEQREKIWQLAKNTGNPEIERIAQRLFKTRDTVPGGTAGALKYEKQTGNLLSPTGHEQAARDTIGWIDNVFAKASESGKNLLNSFKKGLERVLNK